MKVFHLGFVDFLLSTLERKMSLSTKTSCTCVFSVSFTFVEGWLSTYENSVLISHGLEHAMVANQVTQSLRACVVPTKLVQTLLKNVGLMNARPTLRG